MSRKIRKIKTIQKWKMLYPWLDFTPKEMKMICKTCVSQEEKIKLMPSASLTFIHGSINYKPSTLHDHGQTECHKRAVHEKEHEEAERSGASLQPRKVVQAVPEGSAIRMGLHKMGENEQEAIIKLYDIAYYIALKGHAFTDFHDMIDLEKLHNVQFQAGSYENESACRDFIHTIAHYLFDDGVIEKLKKVNFIGILCDGSTDKSITEQEVIYVTYRDPDTLMPCLKFFQVAAAKEGQGAGGLKKSIKQAFIDNKLLSVLNKKNFLVLMVLRLIAGKNRV